MKPTLKTLAAELAAANEKIAGLTARLEPAEAERDNLRSGRERHAEELEAVRGELHRVQAVLAPFARAKGLDWPDPDIEAVRPITFGQLKAACDLACSFQ